MSASNRPKRKASRNVDYTDKQAELFRSFFRSEAARVTNSAGSPARNDGDKEKSRFDLKKKLRSNTNSAGSPARNDGDKEKSRLELKKKLHSNKRQQKKPAKTIFPTKRKSASSSAIKAINSGPSKRKRYRSNPEVNKWKNLGLRVGDKYEVWFEDGSESRVYTSTIKAITYSSVDDKICNCRNCRTIWGLEGGIPAAAVKIEYGDKSHEVFSFQEFQDRLTDNGRPDGIYPHTLRQISRGKEIVSRPAKR